MHPSTNTRASHSNEGRRLVKCFSTCSVLKMPKDSTSTIIAVMSKEIISFVQHVCKSSDFKPQATSELGFCLMTIPSLDTCHTKLRMKITGTSWFHGSPLTMITNIEKLVTLLACHLSKKKHISCQSIFTNCSVASDAYGTLMHICALFYFVALNLSHFLLVKNIICSPKLFFVRIQAHFMCITDLFCIHSLFIYIVFIYHEKHVE